MIKENTIESLTNNIIEKLYNLIEQNKIPKEEIIEVCQYVTQRSLNITFAKGKYPKIEWNDDPPTNPEIIAISIASKINSETFTNGMADNLQAIQLVHFFTKLNRFEALETPEGRLNHFLTLEPHTKLVMESIYNRLKKETI